MVPGMDYFAENASDEDIQKRAYDEERRRAYEEEWEWTDAQARSELARSWIGMSRFSSNMKLFVFLGSAVRRCSLTNSWLMGRRSILRSSP